MAESIEEAKSPNCFIPEDLLNILKNAEKVISEFAKDLESDYSKELAREAAEDVLILGGELSTCGPVKRPYLSRRKDDDAELIPKYLFIKALTAPRDSERGKNEIKEGQFERLHFLKELRMPRVRETVLEEGKKEDFKAVENYDAMKKTVEEFIKTRAKVTKLPIIIFLGHGTPEGELAFLRSSPASSTVLSDMRDIFNKFKPKAMKDCQLRMVFSQCYAHLIDGDDPKRGAMRFGGIEYMYLTNPEHKKTRTDVTKQHNFDKYDSLHKLKYSGDVNLQLFEARQHALVIDAVSRLKTQDFADYNDDDLKDMILEGPDPALREDKKRRVQAERRSLKKFLHVSFTDLSPTRQEVDNDGFTVVLVGVTSPSALENQIEKFLNSTKDVGMPVVMVSGKGKVVKKYLIVGKSRLKLDFGDATVDAGRLLAKARAVYANVIEDSRPQSLMDLRMVFSCRDASGEQLLFSNAVPPEVVDAKRRELQEYAYVVVGDSDHNKTGIDIKHDPDVTP